MNPTTDRDGPWLGLDVGGANIKAAHETVPSLSVPFPLWRDRAALPTALGDLVRRLPPFGRVALTMTAELCDCYATKAEGVRDVVGAVFTVAGGREVRVWGIDSRFHDVEAILAHPHLAASANWLALAEVAARLAPIGPGLLIDIGSTTTDLIPLADGRAIPRGRTDTERLATGELVYAGVRRTPVCSLATSLPHRGVSTGLAAELFATTLDVYLTLGAIPPDPSDLATADGRPASVDAARDRLARMVGADREGFTPNDALSLADAADSALVARLIDAAHRATGSTVGPPHSAIVAGSGEFLALRVARLLLPPPASILSLRELWGAADSAAACARALIVLSRDQFAPDHGQTEPPLASP